MKWHSNICDAIPIIRNHINVIYFEDAEHQFQMRQLLTKWSKNEQMDYPYFIFTIDDVEVMPKHMNLLVFNSGELQFFKEKEAQKQLLQLMKYEIEQDEQLFETYTQLLQQLEQSFIDLTIQFGAYEIEFLTESINFEQLIKIPTIEISYEDEPLNKILNYRNFLLQSSWHLNYNKKTNVCFYNFPENELTSNDFLQLFHTATDNECTVICLISNEKWIESVPLSSVHLIKRTGARYDIESLYEHIKLFQNELEISGDKETLEALTKKLAIYDFSHDTALLEQKWREFLESNKF